MGDEYKLCFIIILLDVLDDGDCDPKCLQFLRGFLASRSDLRHSWLLWLHIWESCCSAKKTKDACWKLEFKCARLFFQWNEPRWTEGSGLASWHRPRKPSFPGRRILNLLTKEWGDGNLCGGGSSTQSASTKCAAKKI